MTPARWEHLEHDADIGVRGYGNDLAEAFSQAALSLSSVVTELNKINLSDSVAVECKASEFDLLLVDWLNEVVYQMATRNMLFGRFDVQILDHHLQARLFGEKVDQDKHHPAVEIKGATFTDLKVYRTSDDEWVAQCIIDV